MGEYDNVMIPTARAVGYWLSPLRGWDLGCCEKETHGSRRGLLAFAPPGLGVNMAHTYSHILVHLVFSTKDRRPFIDAELKPRLLSYMGGILKEIGAKELAANAVSDHVHLLASLPTTLSVADMMRIVKTNSSKWVHETWPAREFGWQTGYGAFSVSKSNANAVRAYIANQEQHHRTVSFQDAFVEFPDKHGIEYDSRFLWE